MKDKAPKPPDPLKTAQTQQQFGTQAAQQQLGLNALDRTGPFGSVQFTRNAEGVPTGQTAALSPQLQGIFDPTAAAATNLAGLLPQGRFQLSDVPQGIDLQSNFFDQQLGLLEPTFARQRQAAEVRLGERGLPVGSEAEGNLLGPLLESQNLARQQAAFGAVQLTPQEEQRQIQNALLERQLPFQETGQALGLLNQVPTPGFAPQPTAGISAPNFQGLQQQNFQNQAQIASDRNAALGSILGAAGGLAFSPLNPRGATTLAGSLFNIGGQRA